MNSLLKGSAVLTLLAFGACAEDQRRATPDASIAIDSAGIRIVSNRIPQWRQGAAWHISESPILKIGAVDGPAEQTFGKVRAAGFLPGERIYVGDEQAHAIRIFSSDGQYLETVGGEGEGPGELQWFLNVLPYRQDSLFVYDYGQGAVSIFGPDLRFARRFANPVPMGNYWVSSPLSDGRFIVYSPGSSRPPGGPGIVPDSSYIVIAAADGQSVDTVGTFRVKMAHLGPTGRSQSLFLQPYAAITAAGDRVLWTDGEAFQYVEADPDGTVRLIVRKEHDPVPVTESTIRTFQDHYIDFLSREGHEGGEFGRDNVRRSLEEGEYYHSLPATSADVIIDALGNRWIGRYHFPGAVSETWEVFDSVGIWLGSLSTPPGLDVHQIGADRLIGVVEGELGVPYVQVHELDRGSRDEG